MRIEQLMYLIDIAQTQSISKTAQNFYITQQGISDTLKRLEKEFDVELLQRTKYGVFLTPMGEYFVEKGREMVGIYEGLLQRMASEQNSKLAALQGELIVMAHPRIYHYLLPDILQVFCKHCPEVQLRVYEQQTTMIIEDVLQEKIDLGLICLSEQAFQSNKIKNMPITNQLQLHALLVDDLVVCANHTSPLAAKGSLTSNDIAQLPIVTYDSDLPVNDDDMPPANSNIAFSSNDIKVHRQFVENGLALDIMSKLEYRKSFADDPHFIAIPLKKGRIVIALVIRKDKNLSPQADYFVQLMRKINRI